TARLYLASSLRLSPSPACSVSRRRPPASPLLPSTTLFRSCARRRPGAGAGLLARRRGHARERVGRQHLRGHQRRARAGAAAHARSEEHTSELQSRRDIVYRLLLEKKKRRAGFKWITSPITV